MIYLTHFILILSLCLLILLIVSWINLWLSLYLLLLLLIMIIRFCLIRWLISHCSILRCRFILLLRNWLSLGTPTECSSHTWAYHVFTRLKSGWRRLNLRSRLGLCHWWSIVVVHWLWIVSWNYWVTLRSNLRSDLISRWLHYFILIDHLLQILKLFELILFGIKHILFVQYCMTKFMFINCFS